MLFVFGTTGSTSSAAWGQSVWVVCCCCCCYEQSDLCGVCSVPEVHVRQGTSVHLTRSSLEGDDPTRLSCLFHHLVFWEEESVLCKLFILAHVRESEAWMDNGSTVWRCLCVILARLPTFINKLCKYWDHVTRIGGGCVTGEKIQVKQALLGLNRWHHLLD